MLKVFATYEMSKNTIFIILKQILGLEACPCLTLSTLRSFSESTFGSSLCLLPSWRLGRCTILILSCAQNSSLGLLQARVIASHGQPMETWPFSVLNKPCCHFYSPIGTEHSAIPWKGNKWKTEWMHWLPIQNIPFCNVQTWRVETRTLTFDSMPSLSFRWLLLSCPRKSLHNNLDFPLIYHHLW